MSPSPDDLLQKDVLLPGQEWMRIEAKAFDWGVLEDTLLDTDPASLDEPPRYDGALVGRRVEGHVQAEILIPYRHILAVRTVPTFREHAESR